MFATIQYLSLSSFSFVRRPPIARRERRDRDFYLYPSMTYQWSPQTSFTLRGEFITEKRQSDDGLLTLNNNVSLVAKYDVVYQEPIDVDRDYGEAVSAAFRTQLGRWTVRANGRSTWHVDTRRAIETNGLIPVARTPLENSTIARRYRHQRTATVIISTTPMRSRFSARKRFSTP